MTCTDVDRLMTPFVDALCTPAEAAAMRVHLQHCADCRARAAAETMARDVLRTHAAQARQRGGTPLWRPRIVRLGQPLLPVRASVLFAASTAAVLTLVVAGAWWLRPIAVTTVGVVGDSFCNHSHALYTQEVHATDRECTLGCVARGAEFVLVTATDVYRIRNQDLPELRHLANQPVRVEGTLADGGIVVHRMVVSTDRAGTHPADIKIASGSR